MNSFQGIDDILEINISLSGLIMICLSTVIIRKMHQSDVIFNFHILVHTSVLPEPFGRVILEGMILRKPVIATNQGGPLEIIENGISGILIPPEDPKSLADNISFLFENKNISNIMGENARRRIEEKFNIIKTVKKIEELYSSLLRA